MNKYRRMLPRVAALVVIGLGVLAASLSAAAADRAARFCTSCDIACAPGHNQAVQLARCWQPVVEWRFDRDLGNWQVKNYQKALKIETADDAAWGRSLCVHRDDKEIDTAFELTSPPIPVAEGTLCRLTIAAAHTLDLSMAQGHKESFQNQIRWLDGDGRELEATPFRFAAPSDAWYDVTVESRVPRGAAMAVVQIGFDSPNLFSSRQFWLRSVAWFAQPDPLQYEAEGEMLSRPQRMTEPCEQGRVFWQADTPEGTRVGLQVRSAADRDGGPCDWTPLAGPDGTPTSQFTSSGTTGGDAIAPAVQRKLDAGLFPGAVVLVGRPGKLLYHDAFGEAETLLKSPGTPRIFSNYLKDSTGDRQTDAGRTAAANAVRVAGDFLNAPPRGPVVHYAVPAMSGVQRLPDAYPADGAPGAAVAIVAARGEYEPGSFVVCALDDVGKCDFAVGPLKTEDGAQFPAADLDLRLVKVWYQNRNAWFNYFGDTGFKLVPELLLHDEDLIRVDESQEANYARITPPGGGRPEELWINPPRQMNRRFLDHYRQTYTFAPMKPGFADAASLRPVAFPRGRFVQFFLTAHVREDAQPGTYSGAIGISQKGKTLASVPVTLRVLPFVLPAPKAYGDPQRDFLVASYTYINVDMIKEENGGDAELARRQLAAILRDHVAHGQTMHWNRGNCNAETLETIAAMKEAGMRTDILLGGLSPHHNAQGSPRDLTLAARRQREWFDRHVGHHNVFIGYGDEPGASWLVNARPVFEAYQREGFKFILAGGNSVFYKTGYVFDWHNVAKDPADDSSTRLWNQVHHAHVAWYAVQHVGAENPDYNRRQNGLLPYLSGYSALCNYAHHLGPYNDDATTYRPMVFVYGMADGVIDTLQWEGFREGVDDIRYATLLHGLAVKAAAATNLDTVYAGRKALQWFALFDKDSGDLSTARLEMIRMIIQLASLPGVR